MKMYTLMIKGKFDSAHFLPNYDGKCKNVHGHTWHVTAGFGYPSVIVSGSQEGMCQDFTILKNQWKVFEDRLDHAMVNKIVSCATAELIAKWLFEEWKIMNDRIIWIEIWETESAGVRYEPLIIDMLAKELKLDDPEKR